MNHKSSALVAAFSALVVAGSLANLHAQAPAAKTAAPAKASASAKTPWGDPDISGVWTSDAAIGIPMQRPDQFGGRAELNEEEFAAKLTRDAAKIIVPVLPSDIDIHAASRCIADLLLVAKIKRAENRIGVIANRVRKNTLMFQSLMRFLEKLDIPVVATVRDSQNYVRAAEQGVGIHEMKPYTVKEDLAQWETLLAWLEPERVLADQPAPLAEQPAPVAVPAPEAIIEKTDDTAAHDARFVLPA